MRTRLYRGGKCVSEDFDVARISNHLEDSDAVVWLDLCEPRDGDLEVIAEEFGLNPLAVEDALTERQRPKLDHYDDHVFISMYDARLDADRQLATAEWAIFAAPHYLITVRKDPNALVQPVVERWDGAPDLAVNGVAYLLWGLLDVIVDGHFDAVESLDDAMESIETDLFDESAGQDVQRRTYNLRKSLTMLRRIVLPTREVLNSLMRRETKLVDEAMLPYYQDVYDHVLRATEWTESLRDMVSTMLETYLTLQGNRMNLIMKKVTSWAAIAAVPAVVTGYYGMNVRLWPAAGTLAGGISALVLMVLVVVVLYVSFRRRDWL
jgi:magnesium transporter